MSAEGSKTPHCTRFELFADTALNHHLPCSLSPCRVCRQQWPLLGGPVAFQKGRSPTLWPFHQAISDTHVFSVGYVSTLFSAVNVRSHDVFTQFTKSRWSRSLSEPDRRQESTLLSSTLLSMTRHTTNSSLAGFRDRDNGNVLKQKKILLLGKEKKIGDRLSPKSGFFMID